MMVKISLKQINFTNSVLGLLFLYIGVVYFSIAVSNIFLGLAIVVFILGVFSKKIQLNFKTHNWYSYAFIIVPFLLTIHSVIYSVNIEKGIKYLWLRLPILVIPFMVLFMVLKKKDIKTGLKIFVLLTIIASLETIYNAIRYINEDILFITDFTFFITVIQHPYFGVFVLLALISIIEFKLIKNKILIGSVFVLLVTVIALTTSRLVYLLFFLIVVIYLFKILSKKAAIFFTIAMMVLTSGFIISNKNIVAKFQNSIQYENSPRLKLWNNSYKLMNSTNSMMFGIGIGDYYQDKKDPYFFRESASGTYGYNPHSQFVEFFVTNGVLGLLILGITIAFGVRKVKKQNRFAIIVFGIIMLFSLTESILSRQYGVQLYSVFIPLIFNKTLKSNK